MYTPGERVGLGWAGLGWVGLGRVGLGWVGLDWVESVMWLLVKAGQEGPIYLSVS